jgi:deoxyribose-phosphate aldolase
MNMYTVDEVAGKIDHAVLKPTSTDADVIAGCELGRKYKVATVCLRPSDVATASKALAGSGVGISAVVGFPHGSNRAEVKALEARLAIEDGAVELDMVMNIGKFLSGDFEYVRQDIEAVVAEARKHDVLVKVILETCYLDARQIARACKIAQTAGADYVKTSTGFAEGSATPEAIEIMIKTVGDTMGVKASGGIRSFETAEGFLRQGCARLGIGSTAAVLDGAKAPDDEQY